MNQNFVRQLRTLLVLGRVSNLPTVWSNCLAGWWLSGGGNYWKLPFLFIGVSALYIGGMFLNDAFDAEFDRQRRASRPIPSGTISVESVWSWSFACLGLGAISLIVLGVTTGAMALALLVCIIIYDATHKAIMASPWLMGLCRFWVYVIAGSIGARGLNGWPIWCGVALALYVVGLSHVAKRESFRGPVPFWPLLLLGAPVILAMMMNAGEPRTVALWVSLIFALWTARSVRTIFHAGEPNVRQIVSDLLAGIIFADWLAVAPLFSREIGAVFLVLFGITLLAQRFIPAT